MYASLTDLKTFLSIDNADDDAVLTAWLGAASDLIDGHCNRTFSRSTTATARTFVPPYNSWTIHVDEFAELASVKVDNDDDGVYETMLTTSDYFVSPVSAGRPYSRINAVGIAFPRSIYGRPTVQVTAKWGWPCVPDAVKQATVLQAAALWKRNQSPDGILATDNFGVIRVPGTDRHVAALLNKYTKVAFA